MYIMYLNLTIHIVKAKYGHFCELYETSSARMAEITLYFTLGNVLFSFVL